MMLIIWLVCWYIKDMPPVYTNDSITTWGVFLIICMFTTFVYD